MNIGESVHHIIIDKETKNNWVHMSNYVYSHILYDSVAFVRRYIGLTNNGITRLPKLKRKII